MREQAGCSAKAHWRAIDDPPSVGSNLDGAPMLIGEIKIDAARMLRDADVDRPLRAIKLGARLEHIERRPDRLRAWDDPRRLVIATAQPPPKARAADGPSFPLPIDREIGKCGASNRVK